MKKIIGIALVLAVITTLVFSSVALADDPDDPVELYAEGDSTAEWVTDPVREGDYSVELSMRGGWWDSPNNNAEVQISITGNPKISDVTSWSYWTTSPDKYTVPIELNLDTTGEGEIDKVLWATKAGDTPDGWFEVDQDAGHWWSGAGSPDNWAELQAYVAEHYLGATLLRVDLGYGPLGSNQAIDAYVDGFTINGVTYNFEPPPEPEPKPSPIIASYIQIWLPDGKFSIRFNGNRRAPIDVNDGTWRFQLAPNVIVWDGKFGGAAERIIIGEDGQVANDVWFQRGEPIITRWGP